MANFNTLCNGRKNVVKFLKDYSSIIFDVKKTPKGKGIKISTPKQILQRLPPTLAKIKSGNTSYNLLNEICQLIYHLHHTKEIVKKVYNKIMSSIKLSYKKWIKYL